MPAQQPSDTPSRHAITSDPLRPGTLADFHGQPDVERELGILLGAANSRREPPAHVLLSGPPGLGKTTLAAIIAHETNLPIVAVAAPSLTSPSDLTTILIGLDRPAVLFVDEIHQLPLTVEETLYTAMEDNRIDIVVAENTQRRRVIPMTIAPFTLVGATTRTGSLGAPFRDRFGYIARLRPYTPDTLATIVTVNADKLGLPMDADAATLIASRSRGTPRIANRLLRRVRDYQHAEHATGTITVDYAQTALDAFGVDTIGLTSVDRDLLTALCKDFGGGPVGVATLAAVIGETPAAVEDVNEPYLMRAGLLARTPRGRVATAAAFTHIGLPVPAHLHVDTLDLDTM